jgi:hypothetical protein
LVVVVLVWAHLEVARAVLQTVGVLLVVIMLLILATTEAGAGVAMPDLPHNQEVLAV